MGRANVIALVALLLVACGTDHRHDATDAMLLTGGDPARGREAIARYGCGACHAIPGVPGARGLVGPSLAGVAARSYVAGVLTNTPDNMARWIRDPQAVDSLTAMPTLGVSEADARDITGYLYTLR